MFAARIRTASAAEWAAADIAAGAADGTPRALQQPFAAETVPLGALPEHWHSAWDELARQAAEPNVFAERWFVLASAAHLDPDGSVRLIGIWSGIDGDSRLVGLLPVRIARKYGRIPLANVQNWLHFHSFLGTPLVRAGQEEPFWTAILQALDGADWACGLFHVNGMVEGGPIHAGLQRAAAKLGRRCDVVHRTLRALLESDLPPQAYYEQTIRKKKRKELNRLSSRLAELGTVTFSTLGSAAEVEPWCDLFLALERSGWKGEAGSALGCAPTTEAFFRDAVAGAFAAGRLDFLRLDLDGRPIAMLVNFMAPPGGFSFKIAFDESYARFSPGVLIQLENLRVLAREDICWMDSCAAENHPMINSLWAQRRAVVRVTVPLSGLGRGLIFRLCRAAEQAAAWVKSLRASHPVSAIEEAEPA
jgi:CelD/BcsL family acetyltransferase involved in cellulose biosynthesis